MVYGFRRMNITIEVVKDVRAWRKAKIMMDGPIVNFGPVWDQGKTIIGSDDYIVMAAYGHGEIPVGYIIHSLSKKETSVGLSKTVSEQSKEEIETALKAELEKILEAQKK